MNIDIATGTYIVAVSGGVDSMALIDILSKKPNLKLIVAHFDHGIRTDSVKDRELVESVVKDLGLDFEYGEGKLGSDTSEDTARQARYEFLKKIKTDHKADSIITAHHKDDLIETAIINLLRGTGRKGLSSLDSSKDLLRPLLSYDKSQIIEYAKENNLKWREDSTNQDTKYLRNYIRQNIIPKLSEKQIEELYDITLKAKSINQQLNLELISLINTQDNKERLDRRKFIMLPHDLSKEVMIEWLNLNGITNLNRKQIDNLVVCSKTYMPGKKADINVSHLLMIGQNELEVINKKH